MDSITDRIKQTAENIHAPASLRASIMMATLDQPVVHNSNEGLPTTRKLICKSSPYYRTTWLSSIGVAMVMVFMFVQSNTPPTPNTNSPMNIAEDIISIAQDTYYSDLVTENSHSTLHYINSLQVIRNLIN